MNKKTKYFIFALSFLALAGVAMGESYGISEKPTVSGEFFNGGKPRYEYNSLDFDVDDFKSDLLDFSKKYGSLFMHDSDRNEIKELFSESRRKFINDFNKEIEEKNVDAIAKRFVSPEMKTYDDWDYDKIDEATYKRYVKDILDKKYEFKDEEPYSYGMVYDTMYFAKRAKALRDDLTYDMSKLVKLTENEPEYTGGYTGEYTSIFAGAKPIDKNTYANADDVIDRVANAMEKLKKENIGSEIENSKEQLFTSISDLADGNSTLAFDKYKDKLLYENNYEKYDRIDEVANKYGNAVDRAFALDKHENEINKLKEAALSGSGAGTVVALEKVEKNTKDIANLDAKKVDKTVYATDKAALERKIAAEETARIAKDNALDTKIETNKQEIAKKVDKTVYATDKAALEGKIAGEEAARIAKDNALDTKIEANKQEIAKKIDKDEVYTKAEVDALKVGGNVDNSSTKTINIGADIQEGKNNVAIGVNDEKGNKTTIKGENNTVVGIGHKVSGNGNTVLGDPNVIVDSDGVAAIGNNINAQNSDNNVLIGNGIKVKDVNNSVVLGNGSTTTESNVVSIGSEGNERRITNVAPGIRDTDAANVGQVREIRRELAKEVKEFNRGLSQVAAMASMDFGKLEKGEMGVGAGIGHHKNQQSVAVGVGYVPNDNLSVNAKFAVTPGAGFKNTTVGMGAIYKFKVNR